MGTELLRTRVAPPESSARNVPTNSPRAEVPYAALPLSDGTNVYLANESLPFVRSGNVSQRTQGAAADAASDPHSRPLANPAADSASKRLHDSRHDKPAEPTISRDAFAISQGLAKGEFEFFESLGLTLIKSLGQGGMGRVFLMKDAVFRDPSDGEPRSVVLKMLRSDLAADREVKERFIEEQHAIAICDIPHVVRVLRIGTTPGGGNYMTMPLMSCGSLEEMLEMCDSDPVVRDAVIRGLVGVFEALSEMHENLDLIHRDLKPANLLIDEQGNIKIADLGLARHLSAQEMTETLHQSPSPMPRDLLLTQTGMVAGTPLYMSPEQMRGVPLDGRTDLYAMGVILFRVATGRLPHDAPTVGVLMQEVGNGPAPDPLTIAPDMNPNLATLIRGLLMKNKDDRIPSARAACHALRLALVS